MSYWIVQGGAALPLTDPKGLPRPQGIKGNFPAHGLRHLKGLPELEMQTPKLLPR